MKSKLFIASLLFLLTFQNSQAQSVTGSLRAHLNSWLTSIPGSAGDDYFEAYSGQINLWNSVVNDILNQNISSAQSAAGAFNYQVIEFTDTLDLPGQLYYILEEVAPRNNHWGIYVFNSSPCRENLNIQAPHPKYDHNTGKEAIYTFAKLNANSLFISGTHRCNHSSFSPCSGTTSTCSSSTAYRISDMAHTINTPFQATTQNLIVENPSNVFLQVHGFNKQSTDPYVILSNGTRIPPSIDYVAQLKNELSLVDTSLTFKIAHLDTNWNRLIGFTNTQGRLINGSTDPCNSAPSTTTGNFIHFEQEKDKLRFDSTGWEKVYQALSNTFTCTPVGFSTYFKSEVKAYPNPVTVNKLMIKVESNLIHSVKIIDLIGKVVLFNDGIERKETELDLQGFESGVYILLTHFGNGYSQQKILVQ